MPIMLSDNLRSLRNINKYTLEDVAEIIGVSRQSVAKWESGESYPDIEKCVKLAKLYKISLDALVNETLEEIMKKQNDDGKYMFGVVTVGENGQFNLPKKAMEVFNIDTNDILLVVGDEKKGIAIIKCDGVNSFIVSE